MMWFWGGKVDLWFWLANFILGERTPPLVGAGVTGDGGRLRWRKDQLQYKPSLEQPDLYVYILLATYNVEG